METKKCNACKHNLTIDNFKKNTKLKKKKKSLEQKIEEMEARMKAQTDAILADNKTRTDAIIAEGKKNTDSILSKLDRVKDTFFDLCSNNTTPKKKQEGIALYKIKDYDYGEYHAHMSCGQHTYLQHLIDKLDVDIARGFKHISNPKKAKHNVTENKYVSTNGCLIKLHGITLDEYIEVLADTNRRLASV